MIPTIDVTTLPDHLEKQGYLIDERAFLTDDGHFCLFFYNIREVRMCTYRCTFAIFPGDDGSRPLFVLSPDANRIPFDHAHPFSYAPLSGCVTVPFSMGNRATATNRMPFLFIQPAAGRFAVLPFDDASICYGVAEETAGVLTLTETYPREIERMVAAGTHIRQTGRRIELQKLKWHPLSKIDELTTISARTKP